MIRFEHKFDVPLETDAHLVVATIGEESSLGVVMGPDYAASKPVAVANPIFIDVDGFEPSGNLLDLQIPHQLAFTPHRHSHPHS